jgi:hypothetical protein
MKATVIEFVKLPYVELIPSLSISRVDLLVAWIIWGIRIYKEEIEEQ